MVSTSVILELKKSWEIELTRGMEVEELLLEAASHAEVVRHGDECIFLLDGKPFRVKSGTAIALA